MPTIAFTLAAFLALGCASGTEDQIRRHSNSGCNTPGCDVEDSGYGDNFAYSGGDSGSTTPESGIDATPGVDAIGPPDVRPPPPVCKLALPTGIVACDACLKVSCCAADDACGTHPVCLAFDMCVATCEGEIPDAAIPDEAGREGGPDPDAGLDGGVTSCVDACEAEYPTGASLLNALDTCLETTCASECVGP